MKKSTVIITSILTLFSGISYSQDKESNTNTLSGFDGLQWGTYYNEAKEKFRIIASGGDASDPVNIISDSPGSQFRVQRRSLVYRYEFYQKPEILVKKDTESKVDTNGKNAETGGRFFLVESRFPYVPAEELAEKISGKYGARNGGSLDDKTNRGYYLWDIDKGYIIQIIDPYKKKPFSRNIYYLSKEIIEEIRTDYPRFQYSPEIKTIMNILY